VPGPADNRHAFISVADAAEACVAGVEHPDLADRTEHVGGPEVLSWRDVAARYEEVLGRRVQILSTMALNRFMAVSQTPWAPGGDLLDPAELTTVAQFLGSKITLPDALPAVR
jgi:uncharacterized protein YbjT (DUF2867 family)